MSCGVPTCEAPSVREVKYEISSQCGKKKPAAKLVSGRDKEMIHHGHSSVLSQKLQVTRTMRVNISLRGGCREPSGASAFSSLLHEDTVLTKLWLNRSSPAASIREGNPRGNLSLHTSDCIMESMTGLQAELRSACSA